jgi:hypothetical protein
MCVAAVDAPDSALPVTTNMQAAAAANLPQAQAIGASVSEREKSTSTM